MLNHLQGVWIPNKNSFTCLTQLERQSKGQFNAPNLEFPEGRGWDGDQTSKTFLSMGIFLNNTGVALDHELMANKWATKFSNPHFI